MVRAISEEDKYKVMDSLMSCIPDKTEEQYEAYYEDIEFIIRNDNMVSLVRFCSHFYLHDNLVHLKNNLSLQMIPIIWK